MKNKIKYIVFIIILFLAGCDKCGLSDMCHYNMGMEKIKNMTLEERDYAKRLCIRTYQNMIDITPDEKRHCTFWKCTEGKETWRKSLEQCFRSFDNVK